MPPKSDLVLVTGGSGFIAYHTIIPLLKKNYRVRTTVRKLNQNNIDKIKACLKKGEVDEKVYNDETQLSFIECDLLSDNNWAKAVEGCRYVLHIASPFPLTPPKDENELIIPAKEGTIRVLEASWNDNRVEKVIITSSIAAISYGHTNERYEETLTNPIDEKEWSNLNNSKNPVPPYQKSKTIAEQAAWAWYKAKQEDYKNNEDQYKAKGKVRMMLSVVNPSGVFGPVYSDDYSSSIEIIIKVLQGELIRAPKFSFGVIDVRDVADLHILCMENKEADDERFLAVARRQRSGVIEGLTFPPISDAAKPADDNLITFLEICQIIRAVGDSSKTKKVPTGEFPNFIIKFIALFVTELKLVVGELGQKRYFSSHKANNLLGWKQRSAEEAIAATVKSVMELGLAEKK